MKKGILLIASAALALGSTNASAAAPNWYNFQGVCYSQNATVTVQFDIVNKNNAVIYSETHSGVQTNASGIFSLHVGEGEANEGAMPSTPELNAGGLVLVTTVNGLEVSRAPFGAVPYASQAAAVGEYDAQDIANLFEGVDELYGNVGSYDDQIADIWNTLQPVAGILPEYTKLVQEVGLNTEGLANAEQAISELSPAVKGNTAAIAKLQEDVNINIDGIANAEQTIMELTEANMANKAAIAKLEANYVTTADMDNFSENLEMALQGYVTLDDMENFNENLELKFQEVEASIADIQNKNENYEMYLEEVKATLEEQANKNENYEMYLEEVKTTLEEQAKLNENYQMSIESIKGDLEANYVTTADMENFNENIDMRFTSLETEQAAKNENYENSFESLKGEIEDLQNSVVELLSLIEANQEQSNEVTKTLMNVIEDVDALQTKVADLEK